MAETNTKTPYTAEQRKVIARIVKLRKSGLGYPAIAKKLNEESVRTFGREGARWHGPTVRHLLINHFGSADESLKVAGMKRPTPKAAPRTKK